MLHLTKYYTSVYQIKILCSKILVSLGIYLKPTWVPVLRNKEVRKVKGVKEDILSVL